MNDTDMNNIMDQLNNMIKNNQIPDDIKNMINNFSNSASNSNSNNNSSDSNDSNTSYSNNNNSNNEESSFSPDIDINTILKMKQVMDAMNTKKDDPRANLLLSLKPYLKESRKEKVDQYVQLFGLEKAFQIFGALGGENKKNV